MCIATYSCQRGGGLQPRTLVELQVEMMILTLNEKLQRLRKEHNLSQEKVAELVGVSRQSVSKWEIGLSKPDTENLIHLAEIYHVSLDELITASEPVEQLSGQDVKPHIPKIVFLSYIVSFGAIIGYFCPPISNICPPYILWDCMGLIGGIMLILKNRKILMKSDTQKISIMDLGALALMIILGVMLPNIIGNIIKSFILAIPAGIYTAWVCRKFFLVKSKKPLSME